MSASRFCFFLGTTSLWMIQTPKPLFSLSLLRFTAKPLFLQTLYSRHYTLPATAAAAAAVAAETSLENPTSQGHHPWPEWVVFVDRLISRGYFTRTSSSTNSDGGELVYREMNLLKDPCLSFARDRYDIFGSLSKGDMQTIVEGGCPKLLRKVANSAKRLRLYVGLDERNVCSVCGLRGSCDRAYVLLKESEGDARLVDLMRILMFYAVDPLVISGAERPLSIQQAESSARRLLSVLIDLSEASPSPGPVQPSKKASHQKEQFVNSMDSQNSGMKTRDWRCPKCSFMNFSRNVSCRKCDAEGVKQQSADVEMKKGDWNCPQCGCMNFARRSSCFCCHESRPPRTLCPGEWECPKCDFLNFKRNVTCLKCGGERSKESVMEYEEQFWRKPQ